MYNGYQSYQRKAFPYYEISVEVSGATATQQAANTPATGGPGIDGSPRAGETLTATTSGIADEDGMTGAVFAYQWIRHDLATATDTDIEAAPSPSAWVRPASTPRPTPETWTTLSSLPPSLPQAPRGGHPTRGVLLSERAACRWKPGALSERAVTVEPHITSAWRAAQAHPPMSREEVSSLGHAAKAGEYEAGDDLPAVSETAGSVTQDDIENYRKAHSHLSDEEFEELASVPV